MENQVDRLLNKIKELSDLNQGLDKEFVCAFVNIEDINDIALFNVSEIDINILTINFNNWMTVEDNNVDNADYLSTFPQVKIMYVEPNVYKITFDFFGYDQLIFSVNFMLCTASLKIILNNLLSHQINITDLMLNNID